MRRPTAEHRAFVRRDGRAAERHRNENIQYRFAQHHDLRKGARDPRAGRAAQT
jgi:hypothetical protein